MKVKFIHIFIVEANTTTEAKQKFNQAKLEGKEDRYFQSEVIKIETEQNSGWLSALKKQMGS